MATTDRSPTRFAALKSRDTLSLDTATVEDAMHRDVLSCQFETPLAIAARTMATHRVHCVVGLGDVTEDDTRLWGVVSDRDVLATAATGEVTTQTAGGSAATPFLTIGPEEPLRRAAELMHDHGLTHVIVVDPGTDRPIGVLSTLDVAAVVGGVVQRPEPQGATRVDALMTSPVITVPPEMPLKQVAAVLVENRISGVPVVDGGEIVGVLSDADIVAQETGPSGGVRKDGPLAWLLRGRRDEIADRLARRTAREAMSRPPIVIDSWASAASAAALMTGHGVKRLPVLRGGVLVGIVSRSDLVRAFARTDAELERDIRENVIVRELWMSQQDVTAEVHRGEVTLHGTVDAEIEAETLTHQVRRVPGVIAVTSKLTVRGEGEAGLR